MIYLEPDIDPRRIPLSMELLDNPIRAYSWGSQTAIAACRAGPAPTAGARGGAVDGCAPGQPVATVTA